MKEWDEINVALQQGCVKSPWLLDVLMNGEL